MTIRPRARPACGDAGPSIAHLVVRGPESMAVRAIIADGSPAVRDAVRQHLECIGCEVVAEVESAAHVLPIFRTIHPEIVALNVSLACGGQSSPLDLLRLMRKESPATSIVMIGAEPMSPEGQTFVSEGALECVKPD